MAGVPDQLPHCGVYVRGDSAAAECESAPGAGAAGELPAPALPRDAAPAAVPASRTLSHGNTVTAFTSSIRQII